MSRLFKSAVKFDKTPCNDPYTGSFCFLGQLKAWPETLRDSEVAQRRVLSCGPDIVIPDRRVIEALGEVYVIGTGHQDTYNGRPIRMGYTAMLADGLATVQSLGAACVGADGFTAYAGKAWVKNEAFTQQDSKLNPQHQVFFSTSETVIQSSVITLGGVMMLARGRFDAPSGLQIITCDELQAPNLESGNLEVSTWSAKLNSNSVVTIPVTALRIRWQSVFTYGQASSPTFEAGDMQVAVAKVTATPTVGSVFALSDGRWTVLSIIESPDAWICRVKHAG